MSHCVVGGHVGHLGDNDKVGAGRYTVALEDGRIVGQGGLECVQMLGGLHIHRDFNNSGKPLADFFRIKDGDLVMIEAIGGGFTWGSALIRW